MHTAKTLVLLGVKAKETTSSFAVATYRDRIAEILRHSIPKALENCQVFVMFDKTIPEQIQKMARENPIHGIRFSDKANEKRLTMQVWDHFEKEPNSILIVVIDKDEVPIAELNLHIKESSIRSNQLIEIMTLQ